MNSVYRKLRPVAIGVVATASIIAGMMAVWHLAPRDVMAGTPTWVYLGILALLLCPILTIAAWAWDRKAALLEAHSKAGPNPHPGPTSPTPGHARERMARPEPAPKPEPEPVSPKADRAAQRATRGNRHRAVRHVAR